MIHGKYLIIYGLKFLNPSVRSLIPRHFPGPPRSLPSSLNTPQKPVGLVMPLLENARSSFWSKLWFLININFWWLPFLSNKNKILDTLLKYGWKLKYFFPLFLSNKNKINSVKKCDLKKKIKKSSTRAMSVYWNINLFFFCFGFSWFFLKQIGKEISFLFYGNRRRERGNLICGEQWGTGLVGSKGSRTRVLLKEI